MRPSTIASLTCITILGLLPACRSDWAVSSTGAVIGMSVLDVRRVVTVGQAGSASLGVQKKSISPEAAEMFENMIPEIAAHVVKAMIGCGALDLSQEALREIGASCPIPIPGLEKNGAGEPESSPTPADRE